MSNSDKDTVYILDSYGLIYRCYFAFISRPLTNANGENVSALFGFFRNLHSILQHYKPSYIACAMDSKTPTFRHELYPKYKANRPPTPEDLHAQIPWINDVLKALGIPTLQCDGYEADDIIATVATQCQKANRKCRILSGDKDLMQLVSETTQILKPDHADVWKVIGPEGVKAEWGVEPEKMLDLLSLYGDTADNVPGVKGCGVKTACKFLDQYGSLEGIYEHADEIKGAIGQKIRDGKEDAFFSKKLIELYTQVPCSEIDINKFTPLTLNYKSAADELSKFQIPSVAKLYAELSLDSNEKNKPSSSNKNEQQTIDFSTEKKEQKKLTPEEVKKQIQLDAEKLKEKFIPLHKTNGNYKIVESTNELNSIIENIINSEKKVAISTEVISSEDYSSKLLGIALSPKEQTGYYIHFTEAEDLFSTNTISINEAISEIQKLFTTKDITIIIHDFKFNYKVLRANGLNKIDKTSSPKIIDTMIASWLLSPEAQGTNPYSLENLSQSKLAILKTDFSEILLKEQNFTHLDDLTAKNFVCEKSDITIQLWKNLEQFIKKYYKEKLFYEIEMPLVPILSEMELEGIHLDTTQLSNYDIELQSQITELEKQIYAEVGHEFNISSTKQLQEVLFTERGLKPTKKNKTGYSTDTTVLEELSLYDPIPKMILEYRELTKLKSTYVEALPKLCDKNNLIHTTFVQTGTATGRLSCKDPNLQNIPVRNEQGRRIRSSFTSKQNTVFISADYSQIELVVMAHLSKDPKMTKAFIEGTDVHKATASLIYKVSADQVTPEMRRLAKTINFGVIYGMSAFRLSNELGISRTQAQEFIANYFKEYSAIQNFITETISNAHTNSKVSTIFGRSRFIQTINNPNKTEQAAAERIAVNTPIQGSAADIVKIAMIKVQDALEQNKSKAKLLLQVHDELIFECPNDKDTIEKTISIIKENMENAVKLSVPLKVSIEYGASWGEFH